MQRWQPWWVKTIPGDRRPLHMVIQPHPSRAQRPVHLRSRLVGVGLIAVHLIAAYFHKPLGHVIACQLIQTQVSLIKSHVSDGNLEQCTVFLAGVIPANAAEDGSQAYGPYPSLTYPLLDGSRGVTWRLRNDLPNRECACQASGPVRPSHVGRLMQHRCFCCSREREQECSIIRSSTPCTTVQGSVLLGCVIDGSLRSHNFFM